MWKAGAVRLSRAFYVRIRISVLAAASGLCSHFQQAFDCYQSSLAFGDIGSPLQSYNLRHYRRAYYQPSHYQHSHWPDALCYYHCSLSKCSAIDVGITPRSLNPISGFICLSCASRISCLFPDSMISFKSILDPPFLLVVSIVMSIIALGLHRDALNYWYRSNRESKIEKASN